MKEMMIQHLWNRS
ncbi:hypothetical protein LINPERPRIM_LOCUS40768 [Linum perenne]